MAAAAQAAASEKKAELEAQLPALQQRVEAAAAAAEQAASAADRLEQEAEEAREAAGLGQKKARVEDSDVEMSSLKAREMMSVAEESAESLPAEEDCLSEEWKVAGRRRRSGKGRVAVGRSAV